MKLDKAIKTGDIDTVRDYVRSGIDLDRPLNVWAPLHYAVSYGHRDLVDYFIQQGASVDIQTLNDQSTPLHLAASYRLSKISRVLLEAGANPNSRDHVKRTPLHIAAEKRDEPTIEVLFEYGANIDITDKYEETPSDIYRNISKVYQRVRKRLQDVVSVQEIRQDLSTGNVYQQEEKIDRVASLSAEEIESLEIVRDLRKRSRDYADETNRIRETVQRLQSEREADLVEKRQLLERIVELEKQNAKLLEENKELMESASMDSSIDRQRSRSLTNLEYTEADPDLLEVGEFMADGRYKDVFRGTYDGDPNVAILVMRGEASKLLRKKRQRTLLRRELRAMTLLSQHPCVPSFYGKCQKNLGKGDQICLVSELCTKGDLTGFVETDEFKSLDTHARGLMALDVLRVLAVIHRAQILHRDLNPNNILVTEEDDRFVAKVTDFGLSKNKYSKATKSVVGTDGYIAPEVGNIDPTTASDIFSFGGLLIFMFSYDNVHPFEEVDDRDLPRILMMRFQNQQDYYPDELEDIEDEKVRDIAKQCFAINPAQRPTAQELIQQFIGVLDLDDLEVTTNDIEDSAMEKVLKIDELAQELSQLKENINAVEKEKDVDLARVHQKIENIVRFTKSPIIMPFE